MKEQPHVSSGGRIVKMVRCIALVQIRERMEELRSMLGWILVHWRAQKDQLLSRPKAEEAQTDAIYSEATVCSPPVEPFICEFPFWG